MITSGVNYNPSFKAQTIILAPETILSRKDRKELVKMGKKIGDEQDVIAIAISGLNPTDTNPNIESYDIVKRFNIKSHKPQIYETEISTHPYLIGGHPLNASSPKVYLTRVFNELMERTRI